MNMSQPALREGENLHGFAVTRVTPLPELHSTGYELVHLKSGARLLHIHNADVENLFSISIPTPPQDNTGLPHILEHAVLAGSERFPVKEPFFEMIKMSMATFINAMTGPDCTYYPVASTVERDLFNLAAVYFDAVFHPLLSETTFRREAHHLAPRDRADPSGGITINGIVYNEMKGAFSNPESYLYHIQSRGLFPDTAYGLESGGDPVAIPDLDREAMLAFHRSLYHPSNARFFLYGDIPTINHLAFLAPRLDRFEKATPTRPVPPQPAWTAPRTLTETYPIGPDESLEEKTYLVTSWRCFDASSPDETILMRILELILIGNEAAPLKKALIDSGLGVDLIQTHADAMGHEGVFSVGIKGAEASRREPFERCVIDTLSRIAEDGIAPAAIEAAFQQAAYQYLEIRTLFPLHVMDHVLQSWLYRDDPLPFVSMQPHLNQCRERCMRDGDIFSRLIRERLIENPHRLTVTLTPDPDHATRVRAAFEERMARVRAAMSDDAMRQVADEAAELERENSQPNTPEQIDSLPQLAVTDIPATLTPLPTTIASAGPVTLLHNDVPSNGVNTLMLNIDLIGLPPSLWERLPYYMEAISKMGAGCEGYEIIAQRMAASTGGIGCHPVIMSDARHASVPLWGLRFAVKALDDKMDLALELLHDLLFGVNPRNHERLHDVLSQMLAHCRTDLVHHGSTTAATHAARGFNEMCYLGNVLSGLPQLDQIETVMSRYDTASESVMADVEAIRDFLINRDRLTASFTGSESAFAAVQRALTTWSTAMRSERPSATSTGYEPYTTPPHEGLAGPIQVAHCAMAMPALHYSDPNEPTLAVASRLVGMEYILSEIRFKGNAYGATFNHNPFHSLLTMGSYNDPHITRTLDVFTRTLEFVASVTWTQADIDRAIIATAKGMMQPIRPAAATRDALQRHLAGITHAMRETRLDRLKAVTPDSAKRVLMETLERGLPRAATCVVASRKALEKANREQPDNPLSIRDILQG